MIALALAAGLLAAPPSPLLVSRACPSGIAHASNPASLMRPQDWPQARARNLRELSRAKAEFAVMRLVDGCMVPVPAQLRVPSP
jgi:hypothetical protein